MNAEKIKELPEPAFRLMWKHGAYYVDKPEIGDTDVYTAEQVRALLDEVEALTADAERYRWLRANAVEGRMETRGPRPDFAMNCDEPETEWDAAIDAARHEPKDAER
jgi:hypothetical protein